MELQFNIPYTSKVIAQELFHVTPNSFSKSRQKYLEHLKEYYEIEEKGKKIVLLKQIKPFETRMEKRESTKEKQAAQYRQATHRIIDEQPLNTGNNIARIMCENVLSPACQFKHKTDTAARYIRPVLKEDFVKKMTRWCAVDYSTNTYIPLQNEQLDYLMQLFRGEIDNNNESRILSQEIMDIIADADAGNISKAEMKEKTADTAWKLYNLRMDQFKKKFGFRPYKTPYWVDKNEVEKVG